MVRSRITTAWDTRNMLQVLEELPESMGAAVIDKTGDPSVLHYSQVPLPTPIASEFLIKVVAASVNPLDAKTRRGAGISGFIRNYPAILGFDFSGIVMRSPYEAHPLKPGTAVYGMTPVPRYDGSYAEYVVAPSQSIAKKPTNLSHVEAAATPLAALTAWGLIVETARAHRGQRILIHAAAGGVGHFAVQFAHYFGAYVIATGSSRNAEWLSSIGADEFVDYNSVRFEDVIDKVDVVIDMIGNVHDETGRRSLSAVRDGGLIVNVPSHSWPTFLEEAYDAGLRATTYKVAPDGDTLDTVGRLLESGSIRTDVDQVFPLKDAAAAHAAIETGHTRGKIVLSLSEA